MVTFVVLWQEQFGSWLCLVPFINDLFVILQRSLKYLQWRIQIWKEVEGCYQIL